MADIHASRIQRSFQLLTVMSLLVLTHDRAAVVQWAIYQLLELVRHVEVSAV